MLLSKAQQNRFWREWSGVCKRQGWEANAGWTRLEIDKHRRALLQRAGFDSLTKVDPLGGFDRVLSELAVLGRPDDIDPQIRTQEQPKRRLFYAINSLGSKISLGETQDGTNAYVVAIARDRFGTSDINSLSMAQLEQLRNTLAARATAHRRRQQQDLNVTKTEEELDNCPF